MSPDSRGWADRQREACRHLPFPMAEYVAGWAGVGPGLAAVAVCVLLARRLRALSFACVPCGSRVTDAALPRAPTLNVPP
ncbi:hypothetical protein ACFZBM_02355 [Streptomyces lavendulae]|uniref:hypothetical protein n=1 Tax=Streptomyces lavendulae TaxID=1914 RepID=UPI0036EFEA58